MKLYKNQSGIAPVVVVLLLVLVGIVGFAGWRVYDSQKKTNESLDRAASNIETITKQKNESKIPEGFVGYENKELGFKFAYPKEWGDISQKQFSKECLTSADTYTKVVGDKYDFYFSKNNEKHINVTTDDFRITSGQVKCGFYPQLSLSDDKAFSTDGNYEYLVTSNDWEGSGGNLFLVARANINLKISKSVNIQLHEIKNDKDSTHGGTFTFQELSDTVNIDKVKATLNRQDKDFVTSFKKI